MKKEEIVKVGIVGTGQRGKAFAEHIRSNSYAEITALCDTNRERLYSFARQFSLSKVKLTTVIDQFLAGNLVDTVIVTVPDRYHKEVAIKSFDAGKHVMIEKPMALTVEDCKDIIRAREKADRVLQVGFVLRYTPFCRKIKQLLDQGRLGQIMSINAAEYLSVSHSASYMRRWHRKKANSGSFIMAKCCHDIDMMNWLTNSLPTHVASFGDNNFFLPSKQPATHCSVCPVRNSCPYCFDQEGFDGELVFMTEDDKVNPSKYDFDLCVYNDDKDLVDNQVCILQYANNIRTVFSLQMFHPVETERYITINGTDGFLTGRIGSNIVKLQDVKTGHIEEFDVSDEMDSSHHAGGDSYFTNEFIDVVRTGEEPVANLRDGLAGTVVAVAIEQAREENKVVQINPAQYKL